MVSKIRWGFALAALILQLYCGRNPICCELQSVLVLLHFYLRNLPEGFSRTRERKEICFWFCKQKKVHLATDHECPDGE